MRSAMRPSAALPESQYELGSMNNPITKAPPASYEIHWLHSVSRLITEAHANEPHPEKKSPQIYYHFFLRHDWP